MTPVPVADPEDPRLDDYRRLRHPEHRRRVEREAGFFVAEGPEAVARLLTSGLPVRSVVVTPRRMERMRELLEATPAPVWVVERPVLDQVVGFPLHRGVVAAGDSPPPRSWEQVAAESSGLVLLEGINDHENLGAIFRSAYALGFDGVLCDPTCADPWYRRAVRVSMGAVLAVPFATLEPWPAGLEVLRRQGFWVVALTPAGEVGIDEVRVPEGRRPAVLLGAEGPGLRPETVAAADTTAAIPMRPDADSLNVGHAAAIAFHLLRPLRNPDGV